MGVTELFLLGSIVGFAFSEEILKIRLEDGPHRCSGRLEVYHNEEWSTVCSNKWQVQDSKVVCKELKCGSLVRGKPCGTLKKGKGKIWQNTVKCTGDEEALSECQIDPIKPHHCRHKEDVWVICREPFQVRLVDGPNKCVGRLEVYHNGKWGSVCDDLWDDKDANVTCNQINCGSCQPYFRGRRRFGQSNGTIWLDDVECTGEEVSLDKCKHRVWSYNDCSHVEDVSVYCTG
ncbi:CD5 antigen-like isoform X1 [Pyxicephalus adspersus]|uniref:CD5 antigen-like isoform X1 n=1 Tax=Pyxicephalus adspersus TaxID=30357 RepID=UPI003B5B7FDD